MTELKKNRPGRWKAGESGNPAGRKPSTGEVAAMRAAIADSAVFTAKLTSVLIRAKWLSVSWLSLCRLR